MTVRLGELAKSFGLDMQGDPETQITGVCTLQPGKPGCIGFVAHPKYRSQLNATLASAVIVTPAVAGDYAGNALIARDPNLAFARVATRFDDEPKVCGGVHASAVVDPSAEVAGSAWIGPNAVVEAGAVIGERVSVGAACVVSRNAVLGEDTRLEARVWVGRRCVLGAHCRVHPGAVIGSRGFGNVQSAEGWVAVPQLGAVRIGDDVEIGANTTIDRGAIDDTVIGSGVKLDNQIQVAHNVHIGDHTAIAACVGIAGSTRIGQRCLIGGGCGINGHLVIGDDVIILGFAMVTKSLPNAGQYGSGMPVEPAREWRRTVARLRRLKSQEARLRALEHILQIDSGENGDDTGEPDLA
ncbi:UDP-3-O-(3-hydroxymyristoyl)glucosamine N-acyltransferase [Algiphilus sp. W345]|uniref:UDP-3-O-acylglucosamine N-acyltransferase n=1 Tax=Banduia mediterranea TaxID=3075609 RepID=A0ABU2WHA4_9GAMM|nr:UDP-3-O-(3-hydroxymyristoyl)glucosamine N-acyltransferase [Algiphilus sp. W345]MDT0497256.1 UDP-3-O-(3-hydroxymyristoyl)glucosamine N-acyltransferase [Algiphilus sp. W345]